MLSESKHIYMLQTRLHKIFPLRTRKQQATNQRKAQVESTKMNTLHTDCILQEQGMLRRTTTHPLARKKALVSSFCIKQWIVLLYFDTIYDKFILIDMIIFCIIYFFFNNINCYINKNK